MKEKLTQKQLKDKLFYHYDLGLFLHKNSYGKTKAGDVPGTLEKDGYRIIKVNGIKYMAHRLAWLYVFGSFPSKPLTHINGNRTDNRIDNLMEIF